MKNKKILFIVLFIFTSVLSFSQEVTSSLHITLKNNSGKPHRGVVVSFTDTDNHKIYKRTSDSNGEVDFEIRWCRDLIVSLSNYFLSG